ncbi:unnamed protein product [Orchesella dallaii]|uniref:Uncharacterized protein n=1 Tax=Orchesella dallaii TaxID=48710 RepID=A0ABP1RQ00_9HEXA
MSSCKGFLFSKISFLTSFISLPFTSIPSHALETLNLSPQLELFQDCVVQLVLNHATLYKDRYTFPKSYNVAPLSFPTILLSVKYRPLSLMEILRGYSTQANCDGLGMIILPDQGPKFRRIPDQRHKCFVQVYIDPYPCRHWSKADFYYEQLTGIFDMVMDERLGSQWPPLSLGNRVMIHVSKVQETFLDNTELLHRVGEIWNSRNNIISTKLLFFIVYSDAHKQFLVNETGVLTCKDYSETIQNITKKCDNPDFVATIACKAIQIRVSSKVLPHRIVYDDKTVQTRDHLDTTVYRSVHCQNIKWLALLPIKSYSQKYKPRSTYVTELSLKQEEETFNTKAVLLGILFPNSTVLGYKYDEYLFNEGYNVWKQPTFHPHDRQFPVMDTISYSSNMKSVHFLTCAPSQTSGWLSLIHLFSSFTLPVWILLILTSILTSLFVWTNNEMRCKLNVSEQNVGFIGVWVAVEHVEFVWRNLVLQSYSKSPKCWHICSAWLLIATVLTTEYLGGNITNISAPIEIRNIDSFEELFNSNFTIYSPLNNNERATILFKLIKDAGHLGHVIYNTFSGTITDDWDHDSIFSKLLWKNGVRYNYSDQQIHKILNEREANVSRKTVEDVESYINEDHIFAMISKCKLQTYVDTFENIQRLKLRLTEKFPHQKIAMSKKPFDEMYENWELHNVPFSANIILRRSHSLFQSGLIHWWSSWAVRVSSWNLTVRAARNASFQAVSLQGNIQVLFYLYLGMIGFTIIIFGLEVGKLIFTCKTPNSRNLLQMFTNFVESGYLYIQLNCYNRTISLNPGDKV